MNYSSNDTDTIAAIATAAGAASVAIVRVSGSAALTIAKRLSGRTPRPRYAELCVFSAADGEQIDSGLVLYFPAPASYTGEDVVEFHGHGGQVVTDWLLQSACEMGARAAGPGEFTLRAFLNDKLDLTQAESIADLIESRSRLASRAAIRSLNGRFSEQIAALQSSLTDLRVSIEAWLNFPDEDLDLAASAELGQRLDSVEQSLVALQAGAAQGAALADGLNIAIAGPPNAGKSSLLNRLAGYDAAIVTETPGTTRDVVKERLLLDGLPVDVVDTAGLRATTDPVEREGIKRAQQALPKADHVLWLADFRDGLRSALASVDRELPAATDLTIVRNKVDLVRDQAALSESAGKTVVALSALTGEGVGLLIEHLKTLAGFSSEVAGAFSARRRHLDALARAQGHIAQARDELPRALEIAAEELRAAQTALSEITGELTSDDLLGEIFSSFCIGK